MQPQGGVALQLEQHPGQRLALALERVNGAGLLAALVHREHQAAVQQLQVALSRACQAKAALVVYSLSRLARSTKDALLISERLDRAGADLVSLSERIDSTSPMGKMVVRLLASLSEFERDQLSERTRLAMAHLRLSNRRISTKIPLGYDLAPDGRTLIENPAEQGTVRRIVALRQEGRSLAQIAQQMEQEGIPTKNGGGWYPSTVARILNRQRKLQI